MVVKETQKETSQVHFHHLETIFDVAPQCAIYRSVFEQGSVRCFFFKGIGKPEGTQLGSPNNN